MKEIDHMAIEAVVDRVSDSACNDEPNGKPFRDKKENS